MQYMKREQRLTQIVQTALGQRFAAKPTKQFTMYKMAKWLGLSASNKLKKMLDALVAEGYFLRTEKPHRGNVVKHVYTLSPEALEQLAML